ncbi:protein disulfide isomerase [Geranomyces variabilis]|nr:protein disulfide isomerase [Geranomyces variabilis]KAJ3141209.1 protein disulfide-isomerase precursor [Geranomyces variabilis]
MKASAAIFCALAAAAAYSPASVIAKSADSDVVVLTKDNFDATAALPISLIEFYAPWCGHCKNLAPEYEKAATELKPDVVLAKVDCTEQAEVCEKYDVKGYPTLKVFREGTPTEYKGARKADGIVSYMKKQNLPPVSTLTADKVADFSTSDKVVLVGFFKDTTSKEFKEFEKVANAERDNFLFGATVDETAAAKYDVKAPAVVLFKTFDEGKSVFDGSLNKAELTTFIKTNSVPLMDDIGPENYAAYVSSGLPIAYLFVGSDEDRKMVGAEIESLAKEFKGKVQFVYIDGVKFGGHAKNLNIKESWPAFVIQEPEANRKFPFDQSKTITKSAIKSFVDEYVSGKIEPSLKSEAIPATNDEPVKVVVGKNYEDIVLNKKADVLLEIYAPWCGHCKALAPKYEELAKKIGSDKIVIAKMDGTENDLPPNTPFEVEGFPTIKLFKAGSNEIVDFNGDRSVEGFVSFLKEHATNGDSIDATAAAVEDVTDGHEEL